MSLQLSQMVWVFSMLFSLSLWHTNHSILLYILWDSRAYSAHVCISTLQLRPCFCSTSNWGPIVVFWRSTWIIKGLCFVAIHFFKIISICIVACSSVPCALLCVLQFYVQCTCSSVMFYNVFMACILWHLLFLQLNVWALVFYNIHTYLCLVLPIKHMYSMVLFSRCTLAMMEDPWFFVVRWNKIERTVRQSTAKKSTKNLC